MAQPFPLPPIKLLERLLVSDSLLINAERWSIAHEYHRQRQNLHYQSLNQPGIVCGLGVHLIPVPPEIPADYRDRRWVEIQPGIAIDLAGNPIIVPQPETYRIAAQVPASELLIVYLVVSYVDPEKLRRQESSVVQETFRIDEKLSPPTDTEVELCRVLLQPGTVELKNPTDVFSPGSNQLDLRYRTQARSRPQAVMQVAQVVHQAEHAGNFANLSFLLQSVLGLYPPLLTGAVTQLNLATPELSMLLAAYDLLFLTGGESFSLTPEEFAGLKSYLDTGGVLLVDAPTDGAAMIESILGLAKQLGTPLEDLKRMNRNHPLRTQPFLFAALPTLNRQQIHIAYGGGIVLVVGQLSAAWGLDQELSLPRETIRTAQELGINILHFAWYRRRMMQLLGANAPIPIS